MPRLPGRPNEPATPVQRFEAATRLLPEALARAERADQITVVDLGAGSAATTRFFLDQEQKTRLVFCDVADFYHQRNTAPDEQPHTDTHRTNPGGGSYQGASEYTQLLRDWRTYLALPENLQIDVLLVWDYLHYFDKQEIEALSTLLQPHVHKNTCGYGFGSLHSDQPLPCRSYAIQDEAPILIQPSQTAQTLPFAHPQQVLVDNFVCMHIARATLLQEGHLELLFEA